MIEILQYSHVFYNFFENFKKRKQKQDVEHRYFQILNHSVLKRLRISLSNCIIEKNYIKKRRLTLTKTVLILLSIEFWLKIDVKNISNKRIKSKTISKKVNLWKNLNKSINYRNITSNSHTNQCTIFILCNIFLRKKKS